MKNINKFLIALLAAATLTAFSGCTENKADGEDAAVTEAATEESSAEETTEQTVEVTTEKTTEATTTAKAPETQPVTTTTTKAQEEVTTTATAATEAEEPAQTTTKFVYEGGIINTTPNPSTAPFSYDWNGETIVPVVPPSDYLIGDVFD